MNLSVKIINMIINALFNLKKPIDEFIMKNSGVNR